MTKKVLISTGGSGGHVIPAITIYNHLKNTHETLISTDIRGIEYLDKNYKIFESDCFTFFNSKKTIEKKFDLIFIDPPYKELRINDLIEKIIEKKVLSKNGLFIIHRHKKDKLPITEKISILDIRTYGISKVYIAN